MLRRLMGLAGLQGGYLNSSESKDSIRIDLKVKMWQSTSIVACFGLVPVVACVVGSGEFVRFVLFLAL